MFIDELVAMNCDCIINVLLVLLGSASITLNSSVLQKVRNVWARSLCLSMSWLISTLVA